MCGVGWDGRGVGVVLLPHNPIPCQVEVQLVEFGGVCFLTRVISLDGGYHMRAT